MANVLSAEKRQQVIALGRLGWSLRRIEEATGVRRETASSYLKEAGVAVRPPTWSTGTLKTGQSGGDHRLWRGVGECTGTSTRAAARSQSFRQRLRTLPR